MQKSKHTEAVQVVGEMKKKERQFKMLRDTKDNIQMISLTIIWLRKIFLVSFEFHRKPEIIAFIKSEIEKHTLKPEWLQWTRIVNPQRPSDFHLSFGVFQHVLSHCESSIMLALFEDLRKKYYLEMFAMVRRGVIKDDELATEKPAGI